MVQKPLPVSAYSLSLRQAQDLLRSVGMSSALIRRAFNTFARRRERSSCWSRALGEAPERRIDALELFSGLALTCRAPLKEKLSILFYLFDSGETGVLTEDDLGAMISSCASVLRHLQLSLPISNDEAAFAAGAAFGYQQGWDTGSKNDGCGDCKRECDVDEIDLPLFLTWAQQAALPSYALEILALPHRLSSIVDLISSKAPSTLRERYIPETAGNSNSTNASSTAGRKISSKNTSSQTPTEGRAPAPRSNRANILPLPQQRGGGSFMSLTFALPPYLGRIGPHCANVLFEVSTGSYPASDSTRPVVVSVEERCGSRFSLVDSQPLKVRVGAPGVLLLSNLRAETDHRLTFSWGAAIGTTVTDPVTRKAPGCRDARRAECSTLRFTTLPADSIVTSPSPDGNSIYTWSSNGKITSTQQRRCIELVSAWHQGAYPFGEARVLQPYPTKVWSGHGASSNGVSVLFNHGQLTCLESIERNRGNDPWWGDTAGPKAISSHSCDRADPRVLVQSWPLQAPSSNDQGSVSPTGNNPGESGTFSSVADLAPFCGEAVVRNVVPAGEIAVPWARGGEVESGGIDLIVHLNPDWRAVHVMQRCFHVLRRCRLESASVREDGRRMVSTEIHKAVRSLVTRCFQARRRKQQEGVKRSCAHVVLGDLQHPWLGLDEVSISAVLWR